MTSNMEKSYVRLADSAVLTPIPYVLNVICTQTLICNMFFDDLVQWSKVACSSD